MQMIDITPYKNHIYLMGKHWVSPGAPFIITSAGIDYVQIKLLGTYRTYGTSLEAILKCKKVTSIHDLIKPLLVGKNG